MKVTIAGVEYVPLETPEQKLVVGDFVCFVGNSPFTLETGAYGKVVAIEDCDVGVEFPKPFAAGHDLAGRTKPYHGWWFSPAELERVD